MGIQQSNLIINGFRSVFAAAVLLSVGSSIGYAKGQSNGWIMEEEGAPAVRSVLDSNDIPNVITEVKTANFLLEGNIGSADFEKHVLDSALKILKRTGEHASYRLILRNRFKAKNLSSQEYFNFEQLDGDYPVYDMGIRVMTQETDKGLAIRLVSLKYAPQTSASLVAMQPRVGLMQASAQQVAHSLLGEVQAPLWKDRVFKKYIQGQWRLVREIEFEGLKEGVSIDLTTGEKWKNDNAHHAVEGNDQLSVTGKGLRSGGPKEGADLFALPMSYLKINFEGGQGVWADAVGKFPLPSGQVISTFDAKLEGRWASVSTEAGAALTLKADIGNNKEFAFAVEEASELQLAQVSTYYHVNVIHDWVNAHGVHSPDVDKIVGAVTNIDDTCNAYYTGGVIHFFQSGGSGTSQCVNTAFDSVIYHEYGHLVDDAIGGIHNGGLSEAWGDILAMYITGIPEVAKGFFSPQANRPNNYIRTGENTYQFPKSGSDEVHRLGQAWMGFAWKLRKSLIAQYGAEKGAALAEELVLPSLVSDAANTAESMRETLVRDDDDGDLTNGTPHLALMQAAAKAHNLSRFLEIQ